MVRDRESIAQLIADKVLAERNRVFDQWNASRMPHYCWVDGLLPEDLAKELAACLPPIESLNRYSTLRERKRSSSDPAKYEPLVRETMYAFQQPLVVKAIGELIQRQLQGDPTFYAGGVSAMGRGDFLNPHIDNSHDSEGQLYRALNLLYYISPGWAFENGGNLELWDPRVSASVTIVSAFNRLVIMATDDKSWHSVSKVLVDESRYCLSNYFFCVASPTGQAFRQVTTFKGRPEEPVKNVLLRADGAVRNLLGKYVPAVTGQKKYRRSSNAGRG
jgi:Rps23 Pro-64 3,4-dihydroxylase Tpa1-like proline 4-hydroxylase